MNEQIVSRYFEQEDFSEREKEVLDEILPKTNFIVEKEIYRGMVLDKNKVGSLIYSGILDGKPAILKIQGLKPEVNEPESMLKFKEQNKSKIIRTPEIYDYENWQENREYGYMIVEKIDYPKIFEMPIASDEQMKDFATFYQEYKTKAISELWIEKPADFDIPNKVFKSVENWRKIAESKNLPKKEEYEEILKDFYRIMPEHLDIFSMEFCHNHLSSDDIRKTPGGEYIIMSNLFWGYNLKWHDLSFNIWACMHKIRDNDFSFVEMIEYLDKWLKIYQEIPVVRDDKNFDHKIAALLLGKTLGSILVDLGALFEYENGKDAKYFEHLLELHKQLFNYLAEKLEKFGRKEK